MKKDCGCSDYDKCEHEIAQVGATPKKEESEDGKQEAQPEMKKGMSFNQLKKEEEAKKPSPAPKQEPSEPMKRLKPGISPDGMPVLSGSAKDIADVLRHHAGKPKAGPHKKNPQLEEITRLAVEYAKNFRKSENLDMKKLEEKLEKGFKDLIGKLKPSSKPKMGVSPEGKKYEDMTHDELKSHMARIFADNPETSKEPKKPEALAASEEARADLDKGDVIDMKSKTKTSESKPSAPSKKPDTRSRDQKIKDALDSQASKGSSKPAEAPRPGIHAGMSRQELMAQVDKTPPVKEPKVPTKLKVLKSLEALSPKLYKGMSMTELKKAEEQYSNLKSKVEQLLAKGDAEAIKIALEKIKGFNK